MTCRFRFYFFSFSVFFGLFLLNPLNPARAEDYVLPDTGQTKCYNNAGEIPCPEPGESFYGQDGSYEGTQPAYELSSDEFVVTDLNTGLIWQKADDGATRNWESACAYCDALELGGYSDWRIPTLLELNLIVDYGRNGPAIDPVFSCQSSYYWCGSTYANNAGLAWGVNFNGGIGYPSDKTSTAGNYVRCVRDGP